jgi:hypothetical protein
MPRERYELLMDADGRIHLRQGNGGRPLCGVGQLTMQVGFGVVREATCAACRLEALDV